MAPKSVKNTKSTTRTTRTAPTSKKNKPVFRTGTWIALMVLVIVITTAVYINRQAEQTIEAEITPISEETLLFTESIIVNSIEVQPLDGETVKLERNAENAWAMTLPDEAEADQGMSEAAASQIAALRIITEVDNTKDPAIFGLDEPVYVITIGFEDGKTSTLEIGDTTPSGEGYYVRTGDNIYVIGLGGLSALTNLATTPPYLSTPTSVPTATSTPLPTETPVPATEATATP
jgi:hypothetical protein